MRAESSASIRWNLSGSVIRAREMMKPVGIPSASAAARSVISDHVACDALPATSYSFIVGFRSWPRPHTRGSGAGSRPMHVAGLSLPLVFAAGFVSFISPCVLPLVPGYLSAVSGVSFEQLSARERGVSRQVAMASALFFAGFLIVFVALGASASVVGTFLDGQRLWLNRVSGALIVLFGL